MAPKIDPPSVTITELQNQIAAVEGFRVSFSRLGSADMPIEPYPFDVMAPSKWRISDWKNIRLAPYIALFRSVDVYRGDDTTVKSDIRLAALRDSYYAAKYGTLEPTQPDVADVLSLDSHRELKSTRSQG
ncbi:MAG: hypothetical protein ABSB70_24855 [Candidatus Velthaea sp.]